MLQMLQQQHAMDQQQLQASWQMQMQQMYLMQQAQMQQAQMQQDMAAAVVPPWRQHQPRPRLSSTEPPSERDGAVHAGGGDGAPLAPMELGMVHQQHQQPQLQMDKMDLGMVHNQHQQPQMVVMVAMVIGCALATSANTSPLGLPGAAVVPPLPPPDGNGAPAPPPPGADGQDGTGDGAAPPAPPASNDGNGAPAPPAADPSNEGTGAPAPPAPPADGQDGAALAPVVAPGANDATEAETAVAVPDKPQPSYQVSASSISAVLSLLRGWRRYESAGVPGWPDGFGIQCKIGCNDDGSCRMLPPQRKHSENFLVEDEENEEEIDQTADQSAASKKDEDPSKKDEDQEKKDEDPSEKK
eukprot:symbB.v1.2.014269.t1/scaffold1033.1/size247163/7